MYKAVEQCMVSVCVMSMCMCGVEKEPKHWLDDRQSLYIQSSLVNKMWLWAEQATTHWSEIADVTQTTNPLLREVIPPSSSLANRNNPGDLQNLCDGRQQPAFHVNTVLIHWLWAGCDV